MAAEFQPEMQAISVWWSHGFAQPSSAHRHCLLSACRVTACLVFSEEAARVGTHRALTQSQLTPHSEQLSDTIYRHGTLQHPHAWLGTQLATFTVALAGSPEACCCPRPAARPGAAAAHACGTCPSSKPTTAWAPPASPPARPPECAPPGQAKPEEAACQHTAICAEHAAAARRSSGPFS